MDKVVIVKTDMGNIQCSYYASELIEGAEYINNSVIKMRQLLEATYPRHKLGEIDYELYVYESDEINAFSVEIEEGYVIAFSTAVFLQFYKILKNLFLVREICDWFNSSPKNSTYCINAIYDYMIWFIAFHEFFHVINGHCGYLSAMGIFNVEKLMEKQFCDNLISQIVESDADFCAITACVQFIFVLARNSGAYDAEIDLNERMQILEKAKQEMFFLGFAVYHVFLLFSTKEKEDSAECINTLLRYDHPYSSIRMAYSFMVMTYQLGYFLSVDEVKSLVHKISEICIAYDRIYYAKESFDKSLISLAFTEKGVQHIMRLHNGWNDIVYRFRRYAHIKLDKKEEIDGMYFWVNEDGTMMLE